MNLPSRHLIVILLAALAGSCSKKSDDPVSMVSGDDPEMNAAIAKGRSTLPQFWQIFNSHPNGESDFAVKVKISDPKGTEYFWVINLQHTAAKTSGEINNDPDIVKSVKNGDRIDIPEADISDWMYIRNQKMYGNYTIRPLLKTMSAQDQAKFKAMLAEP